MWIVLWLILAGVVGAVAAGRGRSGFGWFLIAVLVSPLLALVLLIAVGQGRAGRKQCAACMEWVQAEAKLCKHCGRDFAVSPDAWRRRVRQDAGHDAGHERRGAEPEPAKPAYGLAALPKHPRPVFRDAALDPPIEPRRETPAPPPAGGYIGLTRDGRRVDLPAGWNRDTPNR